MDKVFFILLALSKSTSQLFSFTIAPSGFIIDCQVKIGSLEGIEVIVSAMKRHSAHEGIQEQGCRAVVGLAAYSGG